MLPGLVVVVLLFLGSFYPVIVMDRRASWPTVEGRPGRLVGETWVELSVRGKSESHIDQLAYKYEVAGKEYRGRQGMDSNDEAQQARVARLARSPTVIVRYDPDDPASSELVDDTKPRPWWLTAWWFPALTGALLAVCIIRLRGSG